MQRSLIGKLVEAFPSAQFIIATHSPFIVSSVRDSSVYVLKFDEATSPSQVGLNRRISSIKLDQPNKSGTASEILRDVLAIPVTLPESAEDDLRTIADRFQIESLDSERIQELRRQLEAAGLGEYYPDALRRIAPRQ